MYQLSIEDYLEETREIPLTKGKVAVVPARDYDRLMQLKWHAQPRGRNWYAISNSPKDASGKHHTIRMHRLIMNVSEDTEVDHIDGDGLNNRISNLRLCSHAKNMCNQKKQQNASSKFKGVSWHKRLMKWRCQIQVKGKRIYLGIFDNELDAARAYDAAARQYFGEFARLNFPEE